IANASDSYLQENFTATDDVYLSFYLRVKTLPTSDLRVALITNAGVAVGNVYLRTNGALRLRNNSTPIGVDTTPLSVGTLYRIGLHQKHGSGADAILEGFVATGDTAFGAPFA